MAPVVLLRRPPWSLCVSNRPEIACVISSEFFVEAREISLGTDNFHGVFEARAMVELTN